jgi:hypothetical protein
MISKKLILWGLSIILLFPLISNTFAQEEEEEEVITEKPMLKANELSEDFRFDGRFNLAEWSAGTDSIADLITIDPEESGEPEAPTVVKIFTSPNDIIVAVRCFDLFPNDITTFSKARDSELAEEDHIVIVFDTFLDGRSGYVFAVNPSGARTDGLVVEQGEDVNIDWDEIWEAKTSINEDGWYAEFRIPIKSISFGKDLTEWGFNLQRRVQRLQETSRWAGAKRDYEIYQTSRAGLLTDLPEFDHGLGLSVRPSLVGRAKTISPDDTEYKLEPSLDITQRIGPNILSALTINTDFAETEVDVRQINLSRFPLFFPEQRTFFLQGLDIFEFGVGLDEDNMIPFYTRRIGLFGLEEDNQAEIPINAGLKFNGRVGNTNFGILAVNTRETDLQLGDEDEDIPVHVPQTTMGAARISQNIFEESSIGVIGTYGDQLGRDNAWSAGLDLTLRTSNFMDEKNFLVGIWGILNDREDLEGRKYTYGLRIDYPNDLLDMNFSSVFIGDGFDNSLSFVPRNGNHIWSTTVEYRPRPAWKAVRVMTYELDAQLYNTQNNEEWESYEVKAIPFNWLFESSDQLEAGLLPMGDRPDTTFEISSDIDIPAGSYQWLRYYAQYTAAPHRIVSGSVLWEDGDYYNGTLTTIEALLAFRPSAFFTLEVNFEFNKGTALALIEDEEFEVEPREYREDLWGLRLLLNFSPDLQFSSLTQYDTQSKELGTNNRLRWTYLPYGEIFIVYNHNVIRDDEKDRWKFISNEMPIKIMYTWRF